jgi:2-hydroxychromene-2-carboxylate isomerase
VDNVVSMDAHRRARRGPRSVPRLRPAVSFAFDLASPATYLAAERVDRVFPGVRWSPALGVASGTGAPAPGREGDRALRRAAVGARAAALRMPLVWPERPASGLPAMRIAHFAAAEGGAGPFVLAASRLAFCGGFDLDDPEVLAEAAAAAGLPLDASLRASRDRARDGAMHDAGRLLAHHGADRLPAIRVGRLLFAGEERLAEAAAASRACATSGALAQHPVA